MSIFYWVIALLLVGMGGFTGYSNWKTYFDARKERESYLKKHPDAEVVKFGFTRAGLYILLAVLCFVIAGLMLVRPGGQEVSQSDALSQCVVYVGLGLFSLAMLGEAMADDRIIATPESFIYEADEIRYKNVRNVVIQTGWFKSCYLVFSGKQVAIAKKPAIWVDEHWKDWKTNKKQSYTTRKERRAAARAQRERG